MILFPFKGLVWHSRPFVIYPAYLEKLIFYHQKYLLLFTLVKSTIRTSLSKALSPTFLFVLSAWNFFPTVLYFTIRLGTEGTEYKISYYNHHPSKFKNL